MSKRYTRENLVSAIEEIRNGAKIRETERKYNILHPCHNDGQIERKNFFGSLINYLDFNSSNNHSNLLGKRPQFDELPDLSINNLDMPITSSNPDLTKMIDSFHDDVDQYSSHVDSVQENQLANNHPTQEDGQDGSLAKPNMACLTPASFRRKTNAISPVFADCILWPSESPVRRGGKPRKKLKLLDAVGAGAWMEYWENQRKIKLLKEENKRKRLQRKKEREDDLKKKQTKKESIKENIKKKKKKREPFSSSEEEDNCLMGIKDNSDLHIGFNDILEPRSPKPTEELDRDPLENDYILIKFPVKGRKKETYYVGKILSVKGREISLSRLRKSKICENKFIFPQVPDTTTIDRNQIMYILKPTVLRGTKRQQSYVSFDINLQILMFDSSLRQLVRQF